MVMVRKSFELDNANMSSVHFSVKYDGPALAAHQMDVRELAPALLGLGELIEAANREIFPTGPAVAVQVKGNFKAGSFQIDMTAAQTLLEQVQDLLGGKGATAAANLSGILALLGLVGGSVKGLISLTKFLKGRKPDRTELRQDEVAYIVQTQEAIEEFTVDLGTHQLYQSRTVRQSLYKVLRPLATPGIDYFATGTDGATEQVVLAQELPWFERAAESADVVSDTVSASVLLQIESAVFKDSNKWRFHDGSTAFFAEIVDPEFLARVNEGAERFGKADVLVVDLRRIQTVSDSGLKLEYQIVKVHEHREPLQAGLLPR